MQTAVRQQQTELYDVEDPGPNDVLFGRGTGSNMHSGNIRFRALIQKYKPVYRDTPKKMKPSVSTKVVAIWRSQNPPGRFLTRSDRFHGSRRTFYDVGDAMARRKAAQCLREKSSKERLEQRAGQKRPREEEEEEEETAGAEEPEATTSNPEEGEKANVVTSSSEGEAVSQPLDAKSEKKQEDMDVLGVVTSANLDQKFGSSFSTSKTNEPPKKEEPEPSAKVWQSLKAMARPAKLQKQDESAWLGCASTKSSDTFSLGAALVHTMESNLKEITSSTEERSNISDSPFLFASFDFEKNQGGSNKDEGGLCFPSLFGGDNSGTKSSSSLFGDDTSTTGLFGAAPTAPAFPSLFGGGGGTPANFPFEEPANDTAPPPTLPPCFPPVNLKQDPLQTIRDRMPTAASLITDGFDW